MTTTLHWSETLALDLPFMDADHQDFVTLLGQASTAADPDFPAAFTALVSHTRDHMAHTAANTSG